MEVYIQKAKEQFDSTSTTEDHISSCEQILIGGMNATNYLSQVTNVTNKKKIPT